MRFTHLMLAAWCVAVLCICLCDMGGATAQLEGQEQPAIKTAYAQEAYGGSCTSDLTIITLPSGPATCLYFNGQSAPGSDFTPSSRCFSSPDTLTVSGGSTVTAICAKVHCDTTALTYSLEIQYSQENTPCPAGSTVELSPYSPLFTSGSITCPPYNDVCGTGPTPTPTPTTTPAPTTTPTTTPAPTTTPTTTPAPTTTPTTTPAPTTTPTTTPAPTTTPTTTPAPTDFPNPTPTFFPSVAMSNNRYSTLTMLGLFILVSMFALA